MYMRRVYNKENSHIIFNIEWTRNINEATSMKYNMYSKDFTKFLQNQEVCNRHVSSCNMASDSEHKRLKSTKYSEFPNWSWTLKYCSEIIHHIGIGAVRVRLRLRMHTFETILKIDLYIWSTCPSMMSHDVTWHLKTFRTNNFFTISNRSYARGLDKICMKRLAVY